MTLSKHEQQLFKGASLKSSDFNFGVEIIAAIIIIIKARQNF
jgi:hypothetical protein